MNNAAEIKAEALAYANLRGVNEENLKEAYKKACALRDKHAEKEGVDPGIIPLNFIGREETQDHPMNVLYAMTDSWIREEALAEALS